MRRKKDDDLGSLKFFIIAVLFFVATFVYKADSLLFIQNMNNFTYYCLDRTIYELEGNDEDYTFQNKYNCQQYYN